MIDGTYLKTNGVFLRVEAVNGYWVATSETTLYEVPEGGLVGVWNDPDTGKLWIDNTRFIPDLATATLTAKAYDQIAIWDNANQTTITTN
jgi:hypothetical protein